jgi:hypothetical protein
MIVNDGHDSAWEYQQNNVSARALYLNKRHMYEALTAWAMHMQRFFKTNVSSKKYLTVECTSDRWPARVYAYQKKWDTVWVVSDLVQHTCVIPNQLLDHPNLNSPLIARLFYTKIVDDKAMEVKAIQKKCGSTKSTPFLMVRPGGLSRGA